MGMENVVSPGGVGLEVNRRKKEKRKKKIMDEIHLFVRDKPF